MRQAALLIIEHYTDTEAAIKKLIEFRKYQRVAVGPEDPPVAEVYLQREPAFLRRPEDHPRG